MARLHPVSALAVALSVCSAVAVRLRTNTGSSEAAFVYDYSHHGQDWMMGTCASRSRQSPINFPDLTQPPTGKLSYMYQKVSSSFELSNNGHTYSADLAGMGYGGITYENTWYNLMNINIHARSEHTFMTMAKPLEIHLVHKRFDSDALLVVAIPVDSANPPPGLLQVNGTVHRERRASSQQVPGTAPSPSPAPGGAFSAGPQYTAPPEGDVNFNPTVGFFTKVAPPPVNMKTTVPVDQINPWDLNNLLRGGTYFEYAGSLTAPPCAEVVTWFVRREPVLASDLQVLYLHDGIYGTTADFGNYRSVMPLNGRTIAVRQAVMEEPPPKKPEMSIPLGPNPRTDREFRAMKWAKDALKIAKGATDYIKDLDMRLRSAAQAHANALAPSLTPAAVPTAPPTAVQAQGVQPIDIAKTADSMAQSIAQAAKEAIASAAQQIGVEAKAAAMAAAKDAAQMATQGLPPAPPR